VRKDAVRSHQRKYIGRYVFKDVRVGVYTGGTRSASSFTFFDDGYEGMPIKGGKDAGWEDASLLEERGQ
jgi:hypothetical protein